MTESEGERAERYEQMGDETAEWGEAIEKKPRRRLGAMVSIRLSASELESVRAAAESEGLSTSAFIRSAALEAAGGHTATIYSFPVVTPTGSSVEDRRTFVALTVSSSSMAWATSSTMHG